MATGGSNVVFEIIKNNTEKIAGLPYNVYVIENKELYNKIKENDPPSFYESWIENTNLVFALDVDLNDDISDNDFDKILVKNINNVRKYVKEYYNFEYDIEKIIVLKTKKRENKQSSHIIFRGLGFENHLVCKNLFFRINGNMDWDNFVTGFKLKGYDDEDYAKAHVSKFKLVTKK